MESHGPPWVLYITQDTTLGSSTWWCLAYAPQQNVYDDDGGLWATHFERKDVSHKKEIRGAQTLGMKLHAKECLPYGFFFFNLITIFLCFCSRTLLRKEFQVSRAEGRSWLGPLCGRMSLDIVWGMSSGFSHRFWSLNSKSLTWRALHQPSQPTRSF